MAAIWNDEEEEILYGIFFQHAEKLKEKGFSIYKTGRNLFKRIRGDFFNDMDLGQAHATVKNAIRDAYNMN